MIKKNSIFNFVFSIHLGQSLIEITVALGALSILMTVSSIAVITALTNAQESKNQNLASSYAQQGIEILRQMRDTSWTTFDSFSGTYCLASACSALSTSGSCGVKSVSCGANVGIYTREITLLKNDSSCNAGGNSATRAVVTVSWSDSKCSAGVLCRQVKDETCFSNIYGNTGL